MRAGEGAEGGSGAPISRAPVDRAARQRVTNREFDHGGPVLAAKQPHVDDLCGGAGAPVAGGQGRPELVKAIGPRGRRSGSPRATFLRARRNAPDLRAFARAARGSDRA